MPNLTPEQESREQTSVLLAHIQAQRAQRKKTNRKKRQPRQLKLL